ncbi:MAG: hypothetical protein V4667_08000 [Bacteroidota bacterium]
MLRKKSSCILVFCFLIFVSFKQDSVQKLKLELITKSLHNGKSISIKSDVYYKVSGGVMVTRSTNPYEKITITNANGEFKEYDVKANTLTLIQGLELSSKNSLFYNFLSGSINDMGLSNLGYKLSKTKMEGKIVVTTWVPSSESKYIKKAEIAHENFLPIFMGFYDVKDKPLQKSFYSNYQNVGSIKMPLTITEFEYITEKDSVITKRVYSNLKTNSMVEDTYLNYKVPAGAKVITAKSK